MTAVRKRNNVKILGEGEQVIVFAHGFGCDQHSWKFIQDSFTKDYRVVLFDYVGSGQSDISAYDPRKYASLEGYAQDIIDILTELRMTDTIFVGHSVSCMIGVLAAAKVPALFNKMVFVCPSPRYINDHGYIGGFERADLENLFEFMDNNYLGWSSAMAPAIMGNADRPDLGAFLTSSFCATDPDIARQFARATFFSDNRADLKRMTIDSLTLQCQEDIIAPLAVGRYMEQNLDGNQMVLLQATGHCPHISQPEETVAAIKSFI